MVHHLKKSQIWLILEGQKTPENGQNLEYNGKVMHHKLAENGQKFEKIKIFREKYLKMEKTNF